MKTCFHILLLMTVAAVASQGNAQVAGDYRSAVNDGNWGTAATWETFDGSNWVTAAATPGATNNVTIRNGFNVVLDASGKNCANLTIESGATFKTGTVLPTSSIRYVRINGDTALINGTFGDSAGTGDAISLEAAGNGNTVTISGTGVFAPARVRVNSSASACTIIFDIDTKFMYTGSSGTGGIALYPQTDDNTFTVASGKTLTFVDLASIAIGSSNNAVASANLTLNVHGTINMPGPGSQLTLRAGSGKAAVLNIDNGGTVVVGKNLYVSTVADGGTTTIQDDGVLTVGNQVDFSNPSFVLAGAGTFTLSPGGSLLIGHPQGITSSGTTGQIQTAIRNFSAEAEYSYVGTVAQVTGDGLPSAVNRLTIDDSLGVTLSQTTGVRNALTLTNGVLFTGTPGAVLVLDSGFVSRGAGYVEGRLGKPISVGTGTVYTFEVGTGTTYSPMTLTFNDVTTAGATVVSATAGKHPRIGGAVSPFRAVNRYWTVSLEGLVFGTFNPTFEFVPSDRDAGADTAAFIVGRDSANVWTFPTVDIRTGSSVAVSGLTGGGDFVVGEPLPVSMLVRSNGTGGGVWGDALSWMWGAVPRYADTAAIVPGDSVVVVAADSCATIGVLAGGKLVLDSSLTVVNVGVEGTLLKNQGGGLTAAGIVAFVNGGHYIHNQAGGSIPTALWGTGSTCEIRAALSGAPSNGNQDFYNVVWDCPGQGANLNMGWNRNTIGGNITILSTGSGRWQMTAPQVDSSATVTIMGDINQSAGQFTSNGTGNSNTTIIIHHYGNINITGGNFAVSRGSQSGTGTTSWYLHNGNFSMANATSQNSNSAGARFVFDKQGTQALTLDNVTFAGGGLPIRVDSGATLNTGTSVIRGSGAFTLSNGATLGIGNPGGLDSTIQTTGTRAIDPGATFLFNGALPQATGVSLPSEVAHIVVDNDSSVTLSTAVTVDSSLSVLHGHLLLNGKIVTLGPAAVLHETPGHTVAGDSGTIMTTRTLNAPSASVDIGGLGIKIGSAADLGSTMIARGHAAQHAASVNVRRYFDIDPTNNTGLNASLSFRFDPSELDGVPGSMLELYRSTDSGASWAPYGGVVDTAAHSITLTGLNELSRWTAAAIVEGIADEPQVPLVFSLKQNFPNPFNPSTTIQFTVEKTGRATLQLFNILGQKIQTLFDGVVEPGRMHSVKFDGGHLPSGMYFYRLQSEGKSEMKKLLLLK